MLGSEETIASFIDAFNQSGVATNKKVGMLFITTLTSKAGWTRALLPRSSPPPGYELTVPDPYAPGNEDFTSFITAFKRDGCECISGTNDPPFFASFLQQSLQQGFHPKFISSGKALLFASAVESYANKGVGLIGENAWTRVGRSRTLWLPARIPRPWPPTSRPRPAPSGLPLSVATANGMGYRRLQAVHQPGRQTDHHRRHQDHQG